MTTFHRVYLVTYTFKKQICKNILEGHREKIVTYSFCWLFFVIKNKEEMEKVMNRRRRCNSLYKAFAGPTAVRSVERCGPVPAKQPSVAFKTYYYVR